jgi:hypothetical protein
MHRKEINFPMQLISYQNSSRINRNYRNNMLTIAMGIADVNSVYCYGDLVIFMLK